MSKKSAKKKAKVQAAKSKTNITPTVSPAYRTEKGEAKKAKKVKVQAKKVEKKIGRPSAKAPGDGVIKVLTAKNPKRSTSAAGKRFDLYKPGMTVDKFLAAGGLRADISWDLKQGFIEIQKPA